MARKEPWPFWLLWVGLLLVCNVGYSTKIPLVGFFDNENSEQMLAFRSAIERINLDNTLLSTITLVPQIEVVSHFDSFNTSKRICSLTQEGIGAIFGPPFQETTGIVHSIASTMDIPHLVTHWDISALPPGTLLNLYPDPKLLATALLAVIEDMDWKSYTIIYEDTASLIRLQEVLKAHNSLPKHDARVPFTVWQLQPDDDNRPLLKEIHSSGEAHIILDCSTQNIIPILNQAKEVNMMGEYHSYIITSLDAHTQDFSDFKIERTNITTLRLVDPQKHAVQAAVQDWVFEERRNGRKLDLTSDTVKTDSALMFDAVNLYAKALHGVEQDIQVQPLDCKTMDKWNFGFNLISYMKIVEFEGMTGKVKFDENGRRNFFTLEITELTKNGFRKIGSWDPEIGINYTRTKSEMDREIFQAIGNKTFRVVSRLGEPYLRMKEGHEELTGNDKFEGYALDLIDAIAKDLGFIYEFYLVPDNQYGSLNKKTKQWNGLIKELQDRKADLAICDLTITYDRRGAVDFTMPFMTLGISILYSKPVKQPPDLFSFLSPLSIDVWIYMATAYLGVSLVLYFLARCSPNEWENPHPCNPEPEELECTFSLHNCLWFSIGSLMAQGCDLLPKMSPNEWKPTHPCDSDPDELENTLTMSNVVWHNIGSLMQQGSDIAPAAISTRIVAGMWWFFVLIMISSYTANLAAFLTMERMDATINSVEDLAKQSKIKYGVVEGGSTGNFFRDSNDSMYQKMWSVMESTRPSVFVKSNDEGVERVLKGKRLYAFFMENTGIEYRSEQNCELTQVGGLLDSKGYGIAMPLYSPYRTAISGSVLKMQESGKLTELKDRWWKEKLGVAPCSQRDGAASEDDVGSSALGLANVGGVFLVLISGCGTAFVVAMLEFLWNVRKVAVEEKISPKEAFMLELKFALQCYGTTKPVRTAKSESQAGDEESVSKKSQRTDKDTEYGWHQWAQTNNSTRKRPSSRNNNGSDQ